MNLSLPLPRRYASVDRDRADFDAFLTDFGLTAEWVAEQSAIEHDQIPMPAGACMKMAASLIHGNGMFATHDVAAGAVIAPARMGGKRTPAGRYTNHSAEPNAFGYRHGSDIAGDIDLVALRDIAAGEEVTTDYREACRMSGIGNEARVAAYRAMPRREQIIQLVADLMASGDRTSPPVKHTLCNGVYMRELFIPAGTLLAGRVHKVPCLNICSSGDIEIVTEHGLLRVGAGFTAESSVNTYKIGLALVDTVWINVFRTDLTDIDAIEREVFMGDDEMIVHLDPAGAHFSQILRLTEAT